MGQYKRKLETAIRDDLLTSEKTLEVYNSNFKVDFKDYSSKLTEADRRAHAKIEGALLKSFQIFLS
ncbi:MAG: hypothetical protein ACUZ8I_09825 [Candidatus Scalindua sp.]